MRLMTALLFSMVPLLADTSDRLPNTRKPVPVRKGRLARGPQRLAAGKAGTAGTKKPAKGGAVARALKPVAPGAASKTRAKVTHTPTRK
jgi:hypothetical protein